MPIERQGGIEVEGHRTGAPSPTGQVGADELLFRVDFDRDRFAQLIKSKGQRVRWEKSARCPRRRGPAPQDHDITCVDCNGSGYIYFDPQERTMAVLSLSVQQSWYAYGRWVPGSSSFVAMPGDRMKFWDRFTLCEVETFYDDLVTRQPGTLVDRPKYDALCLQYAAWVDRTGTLVSATVDVDIKVRDDGQLEWISALRPDPYTPYSAVYSHHPRYVVIDLPHMARVFHVRVGATDKAYQFPVVAMAQIEHQVRDEGQDPPREDAGQDSFARDSSSGR